MGVTAGDEEEREEDDKEEEEEEFSDWPRMGNPSWLFLGAALSLPLRLRFTLVTEGEDKVL